MEKFKQINLLCLSILALSTTKLFSTIEEYISPTTSTNVEERSQTIKSQREIYNELINKLEFSGEMPERRVKDIVKKIITLTGKVPQEDFFDALAFAIVNDDSNFLKYLLKHGANPDFIGPERLNAYELVDQIAENIPKYKSMRTILDEYRQK